MQDIIRKEIKNMEDKEASSVRKNITEGANRIDRNPFFEKQQRNNIGFNQREQQAKASQVDSYTSTKKQLHFIKFIIFGVLIMSTVIALVNIFTDNFSSTVVKIIPISKKAKIDVDLKAVQEIQKEGDLLLESMDIIDEKTKKIPATEEKTIQKKASGVVIIYNTYSEASQRLIKNTRLESSDHKIFRIDESVVVPGAKIKDGKVITPGSVEAVVYADSPGKEYNIELSSADFTIPGFKGDPRFTKFYARMSQKTPITGGFSGVVKIPSEQALKTAKEEIMNELKKNIIEKANAQIPSDTSFFPGSVVIRFEEVPIELAMQDTSEFTMRAHTSIFFFNTEDLEEKIIETSRLEDNDTEKFSIANLNALTFSFISEANNIVFQKIPEVQFHLSGDILLVGKIDENDIKNKLTGKRKSDFYSIIEDQKNIEKADLIMRPFWNNVFPNSTSSILIKIKEK